MHPERECTISELASLAGTSLPTTTREVARAEQAGIVATRQIGRSKLVRADTSSFVHEPLRDLLLRSFGPVAVVAEEFADVAGMDHLFLFGSWAARYEGEPGRAPRDIDILVVGTPDRDAVYEAAERVERRCRLPAQATIRTLRQWERPASDPFLRQIRGRPLVEIEGTAGREVA